MKQSALIRVLRFGFSSEKEMSKGPPDQIKAKLERIVDRLEELARATNLEASDLKFVHLASSGRGLIIVDVPRLKTDVTHYADYLASGACLFPKITIRPLASGKNRCRRKFTVTAPRGHNLGAVAAGER